MTCSWGRNTWMGPSCVFVATALLQLPQVQTVFSNQCPMQGRQARQMQKRQRAAPTTLRNRSQWLVTIDISRIQGVRGLQLHPLSLVDDNRLRPLVAEGAVDVLRAIGQVLEGDDATAHHVGSLLVHGRLLGELLGLAGRCLMIGRRRLGHGADTLLLLLVLHDERVLLLLSTGFFPCAYLVQVRICPRALIVQSTNAAGGGLVFWPVYLKEANPP